MGNIFPAHEKNQALIKMNPTDGETILEKMGLNCSGELCPGWGLPDFPHHFFSVSVGTSPACFIKCLFVSGMLICDQPDFLLPSGETECLPPCPASCSLRSWGQAMGHLAHAGPSGPEGECDCALPLCSSAGYLRAGALSPAYDSSFSC